MSFTQIFLQKEERVFYSTKLGTWLLCLVKECVFPYQALHCEQLPQRDLVEAVISGWMHFKANYIF
jgi:hypothetical protein